MAVTMHVCTMMLYHVAALLVLCTLQQILGGVARKPGAHPLSLCMYDLFATTPSTREAMEKFKTIRLTAVRSALCS